ncbi:hypothetical protein SISSUDRAFT_1067193 [Sistotremastrum suecicum HHB10207 ss-3]|uniref:Uncharacterized protein n=1 Tax=Sistotremastrum suecicum HHB10207 ss-3 TaxID=1314776 RepID=A0A165XE86_9AGAM|nr:hypothetical protein SISSUDRAFT_1067193 [Sistotremastrum suecicum HHB10207 ss-3]
MAPKKKPAATTSAPDNQAPSESQAAQSIPVDVEPPTGRKRAPPFEWKDNDYEKVWELIKEMGVKTNFTILFGKKQDEDAENKTEDEVGAEKRGSKKKGKNKDQTNVKAGGAKKPAAYQAIAQKIFAEEYKTNKAAVLKRVKNKVEGLIADYKSHAKAFYSTGNGVNGPSDNTDDQGGFSHYIPPEGPCHDTPPVALNLWSEVCKKFPFFEELHKLVGRRANVVPIVINGGLGPHGPSAIHPQMPSDEETSPPGSPAVETGNIGPIIVPKTANAPPVETKPAAKPPVSTPASAKRKRGTAHAPKPSMSLSTIKSAAERAHKKRRGPEHEFLEIARETQDHLREDRLRKNRQEEIGLLLQQRGDILKQQSSLLDEFRLGLLDQETYHVRHGTFGLQMDSIDTEISKLRAANEPQTDRRSSHSSLADMSSSDGFGGTQISSDEDDEGEDD